MLPYLRGIHNVSTDNVLRSVLLIDRYLYTKTYLEKENLNTTTSTMDILKCPCQLVSRETFLLRTNIVKLHIFLITIV